VTRRDEPAVARAVATLADSPDGVVMAPGRVDLLGSHTDYNLLPVLACAIDFHVLVAFRRRTDRIVKIRSDDAACPARSFTLDTEIPPEAPGDWSNYIRAAAQEFARRHPAVGRGIEMGVAASLPPGAGLSSSSALVVAGSLALHDAHEQAWDPRRLAGRLAAAEHYVGTRGGGLDHATILCGRQDGVLELDFDPLRVAEHPFPTDVSLLLCHSLVTAPKSAAMRAHYNRRVVECRIGAGYLASLLGTRPIRDDSWARLGSLVDASDTTAVVELVRTAEKALPAHGVQSNWLEETFSGLPDPQDLGAGEFASTPDDGFQVLRRVRHVLGEAVRVRRGAAALEAEDVGTLARLMNESHASARDDFETSCAEVEELTSLLLNEGALAARMCGAGFGGMVAALVPTGEAPAVAEAIREEYYRPRNASDHDLPITRPARGAVVLRSGW
jgi:galactokinase